MIYELRTYTAVPGELPALLKRFETPIHALWEEHGIRQAGFFTTLIGASNNTLTYLLAWESLAEREIRWGKFVTDPRWLAARIESERNGPLVANVSNSFLQPTVFSALR